MAVCRFFVHLVSGRNQVDQNSVYGDSKRVLNSIGGTVNCTYVWCWRTLEQAVPHKTIKQFFAVPATLFIAVRGRGRRTSTSL